MTSPDSGTAAPGEALLVLDSVRREFPGADRPALDDVSLSIHRGDFVSIVGPSGSGKSTLLNILGLLDRPDAGTYRVDGRDTVALGEGDRDRLRSELFGFVFQASHALGDESVAANAALGLRVQNVPLTERDRRAGEALTLLGLQHRLGTRAKLLSGGERQRLAIARAVATDPAVILADEPTGNLDTVNSTVVMDHLRELHRRGTTVLIITHDPEIAAQADRRIEIRDGVLTELSPGTPPVLPPATPASAPAPARRPLRALADDLVDALSSMSSRFLRTVLLMAAFAVGIGGLVAATGLSQTAASQVSARLSAAALDEVVVTLPDPVELLSAEDTRLADWTAALDALPHVDDAGHLAQVAPADVRITRLSPAEEEPSTAITLASASTGFVRENGIALPAGAAALDSRTDRLAWLTPAAAEALHVPIPQSGVLSPGYRIWVSGQPVDVAGIIGTSDRRPELNAAAFVTAPVIAEQPQAQLDLVLRTEVGFPYPVSQAAPLVIAPESPGSVRVQTVADLRQLRAGVSDDLSAFVGVLSGVLLVLAVISASTAMYLSVQARTAEIALRRAIGSGRGLIARLFLIEGAAVGLAGGALGAAVSTAAVVVVSHLRGWTPVLPASSIPLALGLGLVSGVLSGLYPAWVASRQRPADALRG
ncbi:ABC transporter ATP-binding protein/permease [uncultured Micrococcus sp.]|uniref:ABC transporter ATP-binding protein/permease n=1 Tax=uncultured Micrococcus sp. TaxID=114051 RepID=UPI0025EA0761|nr:ABC transporter ATP-binding protein/permease [uncultured Micrococcus sp.]